jgi:uncharacterized damage-inducible protein DinB
MITETLQSVFQREVSALRREVESYSNEAMLWELRGGVTNSAGNLALHLCGNLQHFIGAKLGGTGYVRDRDAEFASRGVSRDTILAEIDAATRAVDAGFARIADADLEQPFPEPIGNVPVKTGEWLLHLVSHLGYHLGQIDYHRRMVTGDSKTLDVVSVKELPSAVVS